MGVSRSDDDGELDAYLLERGGEPVQPRLAGGCGEVVVTDAFVQACMAWMQRQQRLEAVDVARIVSTPRRLRIFIENSVDFGECFGDEYRDFV